MKRLPRINCYNCEYGCIMVTIDVDKGVTPFMIKCRTKARPDRPLVPEFTDKNGECKGTARSSMYPKVPKPDHISDPQWEWFKPEKKDIDKVVAEMPEAEDAIRDEYARGILMLRPRTNRPPLYHD